jgi:hypothetical protein
MFIKLLQKLSWKNGSRHQSSTHESKIRQSEVPKDGHVLENPSEARPLTILEMLPPELIIYMAQFLPLSSTVLFTLSCHAACAILGTRYWTSLQAEDQHQQHIDFLSQLSKDLPPDYLLCYHCRALHLCTIRYSDHLPTRPLYQYDLTPCHKAEVLGKVSKYIHKDFQFRTFQMAMKKYRLGLDHELWLECLCRQSTKCRIMQKFPSEFKADARVIDGSLLFRSQRVILIPPGLTIRNLDRCSSYQACGSWCRGKPTRDCRVYYEPPTRSAAVRQEVRYRTLYRMPDRIRSHSRGVWGVWCCGHYYEMDGSWRRIDDPGS